MQMPRLSDCFVLARRHGAAFACLLCVLGVPGHARAQVTAPRALTAAEQADRLNVQLALAARRAVKISVSHSGWYRVSQPQLVAAGLAPNTNPHNLRLFVDGVEQALRVISNGGKAEGRFDSTDAIEFYGTGLDTPYTKAHIYWLTDGSPGLRVAIVDGRTTATGAVPSFPFTTERRDRTIYLAALKNNGGNKYFGDIVGSWETWGRADESLTVNHLDAASPANAHVEVALLGATDDPSVHPNHRVGVLVNGIDVGELDFDGQSEGVQTFDFPERTLVNGANTVSLVARGGDMDISLVDYVRLTYSHTYTAEGDALRFTATAFQPVTIGGFSRGDIRLVDITDPSAPRELVGTVRPESGGSGGFRISVVPEGNGTRTLLAFTGAMIDAPDAVRANVPSSWSATGNDADYVVVTHADFLGALAPLKALREAEGHHVAIIDVQALYDEFSFGEKTPQAIKDFMLRAHAAWHTPPKFLVLVGNATQDPRDYLHMGYTDYMPVHLVNTALLEVPSDDWFADSTGNGLPDLAAVGRLSVLSVAQANAMVAKLVAYESAGEGGWTKDLLLVADQNDGSDDFEGATASLESIVPPDYQIHKVLRGSLGTDAARADMLGQLNQGQLIVNYVGHGSVDMWDDNLLTDDDGPGLTNGARMPLVLAMTCLNGFFHSLFPEESLAEALQRAPNGGAIAVWASSSLTSSAAQASMDRELFRLLFTGAYPTLGEAIVAAKKTAGDGDVRRSWILFGDPAIRLKGLVKRPSTEKRPRDTRLTTNSSRPATNNSRLAMSDSRRVTNTTDSTRSSDLTKMQPASNDQSNVQPDADLSAAPAWQMVSADLNHDGLADVLLYHRDTGAWLEALTRADGTFDLHEGHWPAKASVRAVDLNGNGRADLFVYQRETGAWLAAFSHGGGGFTYQRGLWSPGWDVEFADFNGDRLPDVLLYNPDTGLGRIGLNNGEGGFTFIDEQWSADWIVRVGDFNGDWLSDVFFYDPKTGAWVEGVGDGTGHFTYVRGTLLPGFALHVADFDRDGRADLFLYNPVTGAWLVGVTTAPGQFTYSAGTWAPGWIVATGDLNGDGRADIFLYDPETGQSGRCLTVKPGQFNCLSDKWPPGASIIGEPR